MNITPVTIFYIRKHPGYKEIKKKTSYLLKKKLLNRVAILWDFIGQLFCLILSFASTAMAKLWSTDITKYWQGSGARGTPIH